MPKGSAVSSCVFSSRSKRTRRHRSSGFTRVPSGDPRAGVMACQESASATAILGGRWHAVRVVGRAPLDSANRRWCGFHLSVTPELGKWSGRLDSNQRPPAPKAGALTRLRYAPTRQEYYENDARRHEALRRRAFVALCVAPCGEGRRIWRALAMIAAVEASPSSSKSSGRAARAGDLGVLGPALDPRVRVVLEVVRSGALETEMSEWLKEQAWKTCLLELRLPPTQEVAGFWRPLAVSGRAQHSSAAF